MENRDFILVVSAVIVIVGWFVNSYLSRKHEISKIRSEYRIETLKQYIECSIEVQNNGSLDGFSDIQVQFLLYGYDDEIEFINNIANMITANPKDNGFLKLMNELNVLVRNRLRCEIGLPMIKS